MSRVIEDYKQQLFEVAAEYGKAGRAAYSELEQHIDEAVEAGRKPQDVIAELGDPEQAIRTILHADGKAAYPLSKIICSGGIIAVGAGVLVAMSGFLMPLGSRIAGMQAISGDPVNLPYTAERCKEFQALTSSALDCRHAAMLHHYYEMTDERVVLVAFGIVCLLAAWFAVRKGWIDILPRKTLLLLAASIYIALGGVTMLLALGDLSAGRSWGWLGNFLNGLPMLLAGCLLLAYYLGYITRPAIAQSARG